MKESVAKEWVAALRSGKYKQTTSRLHDDRGHCCLGVLCEVVGMKARKKGMNSYYYYGQKSDILPTLAVQRSGVKSSDPGRMDEGYRKKLSTMNDGGYGFELIADEIENHWKEL